MRDRANLDARRVDSGASNRLKSLIKSSFVAHLEGKALFVHQGALDSHFAAVVPILAEGRVVPFLGAGVNCAGRAPGTIWAEGGGELPDGKELARGLAAKVGFRGHDDDLLRVSLPTGGAS